MHAVHRGAARGGDSYDASMGTTALAEIARRIYALPLADFVAARTAEANALTGSGAAKGAATGDARALAAAVRSLAKPSVSAWAVNLLTASHPDTVQRLLALGSEMRAAQAALDAPALRALSQERRDLLTEAVRAAQAAAERQGRKISAPVAAEVEQTLRAATADAGAAQAVASGWLLRPLSADGVDVVDLTGALAAPAPALDAAAAAGPTAARVPAAERAPDAPSDAGRTPARQAAKKPPAAPRLRAVRNEPRTPEPSAVVRARESLTAAAQAAADAADEAARDADALAAAQDLAGRLTGEVRDLKLQLERTDAALRAAAKDADRAAARSKLAARAAGQARRKEELARERVLRLGNTPEA